jgi:hypothetical protein
MPRPVMKLDEVRKITPAVDPIAACKKNLTMAVFDAITESDVVEIVRNLAGKAKQGDLGAVRMLLGLIQAKPEAPHTQQNLQVNIEPTRRLLED